MPDIDDGETVEVQGSAKEPYVLRNVGGIYSCTCPAWRNQSTAIERRTCKHLRQYCGEGAEKMRLGGEISTNAARVRKPSKNAAVSP
jgi:DNA ligase 1